MFPLLLLLAVTAVWRVTFVPVKNALELNPLVAFPRGAGAQLVVRHA